MCLLLSIYIACRTSCTELLIHKLVFVCVDLDCDCFYHLGELYLCVLF